MKFNRLKYHIEAMQDTLNLALISSTWALVADMMKVFCDIFRIDNIFIILFIGINLLAALIAFIYSTIRVHNLRVIIIKNKMYKKKIAEQKHLNKLHTRQKKI